MNLSSRPNLNVLIVEEFEGSNGKARSWTKVGVNWGLRAFPRDGKFVVLPPLNEERTAAVATARIAITETAQAKRLEHE
jgi:hypothetical protein